jgi:hypothetical protein
MKATPLVFLMKNSKTKMLGTKGLRSLDLCPDALENNQHGYLLSEAKKIDVFMMYSIHFRTFSKLKHVNFLR